VVRCQRKDQPGALVADRPDRRALTFRFNARLRSVGPESGGTLMAQTAAAKKAVKTAPVKTHKNKASVADFIAAVESDQKRADARTIDKMLREISGEKPAMWGSSMIGYGTYRYTNTMGEADWPKIAFSPRKGATVLYILPGLLASDPLMKNLGKYKIGKSCLYINKLSDVDQKVLRELAARSWKSMSEKYG
jgi:hypothetical protein